MRYEINYLAEFKDKGREEEFHDNEVRKGLRTSRNTVLIFSLVNLLFFIGDVIWLADAGMSALIFHSLIPRIITLILTIITCVLLNIIDNKKTAINAVIALAIVAYLLHEYIANYFYTELIFELFDLVILTFALFTIPSRWITSVLASVLLLIIFIVFSPVIMPTVDYMIKGISIVYLFSHVLVVGTLMFRMNIQKRLNYLQYIRLEELARTDELTKIPNRAACDKTLDQMCSTHYKFAVILLDMDDFKQINDTYGHLAGDEVIVKTIETIKNEIRQDDIVARWGGEEFIIILPNTTMEGAVETANRIRDSLIKIKCEDQLGTVTASFGVTAFINGEDTKSIIKRVDQLLYLAKNHGKNKVIAG